MLSFIPSDPAVVSCLKFLTPHWFVGNLCLLNLSCFPTIFYTPALEVATPLDSVFLYPHFPHSAWYMVTLNNHPCWKMLLFLQWIRTFLGRSGIRWVLEKFLSLLGSCRNLLQYNRYLKNALIWGKNTLILPCIFSS